ncbi:MAG: hypothetical protein IJY28_04740 [Clostridia bacterium]|nr:hypothetical protein [Clostridia bacterium]
MTAKNDRLWTCDPERFGRACVRARQDYPDGGIGTLGEKSIHAILKYYFEEDAQNHECPVENGVADIIGAHGVIEIQTRQFHRLGAKLARLLPEGPVTVVYPVIRRKRILWINPDTGELIRSGAFRAFRKPESVFQELYRIRSYVTHPNFRLCIVVMDAEDFRRENSRTTKIDRIPTALIDVQYYAVPSDFRVFLPDGLPETFSSAQLAKIRKISRTDAQQLLRMLVLLGQAEVIGKDGRTNIYRRCPAD